MPQSGQSLAKDSNSSIFNDIHISCSDIREYAPLPDSASELRQIMFDKSFYFGAYMGIANDIHPINSGAGFVLSKIPEDVDMRMVSISTSAKNPRTGFFHKHYIAWWILLGFTDMLQLNHLRNFALIEKYQVKGTLKDALLEPLESYVTPVYLDLNNGAHHSLTVDLAPLFFSDASPKEIQLFFELTLTYNRLMKVTNHDIWGSTGRGLAK